MVQPIKGNQLSLLKAETTEVRILSLWQPYATLVTLNLKKRETRPRTINWDGYRGKLLIHAASEKSHKLDEQDRSLLLWLYKARHLNRLLTVKDIPYGAVLSLTEMVDSHIMTERLIAQQTELEIEVGNWDVGRKAIDLENTIALPSPIPWKGAQGLRNAPPELVELVNQQLKEVA